MAASATSAALASAPLRGVCEAEDEGITVLENAASASAKPIAILSKTARFAVTRSHTFTYDFTYFGQNREFNVS